MIVLENHRGGILKMLARKKNAPDRSKKLARSSLPNPKIILAIGILALAIVSVLYRLSPPPAPRFPALAMSGGDPYIRALLRAISASESNTANPYTALYGGGHFHDFTRHPDRCVPIVTEPNFGKCTTAAGRYQYLTSTWLEKARRYHPRDTTYPYSFTPEDQDRVTYAWLKDSRAWGRDIPSLLRKKKIERVLRILSPTWTSLGYGIEDNLMTPYLPDLYRKFLHEELQKQV